MCVCDYVCVCVCVVVHASNWVCVYLCVNMYLCVLRVHVPRCVCIW